MKGSGDFINTEPIEKPQKENKKSNSEEPDFKRENITDNKEGWSKAVKINGDETDTELTGQQYDFQSIPNEMMGDIVSQELPSVKKSREYVPVEKKEKLQKEYKSCNSEEPDLKRENLKAYKEGLSKTAKINREETDTELTEQLNDSQTIPNEMADDIESQEINSIKESRGLITEETKEKPQREFKKSNSENPDFKSQNLEDNEEGLSEAAKRNGNETDSELTGQQNDSQSIPNEMVQDIESQEINSMKESGDLISREKKEKPQKIYKKNKSEEPEFKSEKDNEEGLSEAAKRNEDKADTELTGQQTNSQSIPNKMVEHIELQELNSMKKSRYIITEESKGKPQKEYKKSKSEKPDFKSKNLEDYKDGLSKEAKRNGDEADFELTGQQHGSQSIQNGTVEDIKSQEIKSMKESGDLINSETKEKPRKENKKSNSEEPELISENLKDNKEGLSKAAKRNGDKTSTELTGQQNYSQSIPNEMVDEIEPQESNIRKEIKDFDPEPKTADTFKLKNEKKLIVEGNKMHTQMSQNEANELNLDATGCSNDDKNVDINTSENKEREAGDNTTYIENSIDPNDDERESKSTKQKYKGFSREDSWHTQIKDPGEESTDKFSFVHSSVITKRNTEQEGKREERREKLLKEYTKNSSEEPEKHKNNNESLSKIAKINGDETDIGLTGQDSQSIPNETLEDIEQQVLNSKRQSKDFITEETKEKPQKECKKSNSGEPDFKSENHKNKTAGRTDNQIKELKIEEETKILNPNDLAEDFKKGGATGKIEHNVTNISCLNKRLDEVQKAYLNLQKENHETASALNLLQTEHSKCNKQMIELANLKEENNQLILNVNNIQKEKHNMEIEKGKLEINKNTQMKEKAEVLSQLQLLQIEHEHLKESLDQKIREIGLLNSQLKCIECENIRLKVETDVKRHLEKHVTDLNDELSHLKNEHASSITTALFLSEDTERKQSLLIKKQEELENIYAKVSNIEKENSELHDTLTRSVRKCEQYEAKYREIETILEVTRTENQKLMSELGMTENRLKETLDNAEIETSATREVQDSLEKSLTDTRQEITRLQNIVDSYQPTFEEILKREEILNGEEGKWKEKTEKWMKEWDILVQQNDACRQERQQNENKKTELDQMKSDLERRTQETENEYAKMSRIENERKEQIKTLDKDLGAAKASLIRLNEELETVRGALLKCTASLDEANSSNTELIKQIEDKTRLLDLKTNEVSTFQELINKLENTELILKLENRQLIDEKMRLNSLMLADREKLEEFTEKEKANTRRISEQGEIIAKLSRQIQDEKDKNVALEKDKQDLTDDWTQKYQEKSLEFELQSNKYRQLTEKKTRLQDCVVDQGKEIKKLRDVKKELEQKILVQKRELKTEQDEKKRETEKLQALHKSKLEVENELSSEKQQSNFRKELLEQKIKEKEAADVAVMSLSNHVHLLQANGIAKDQQIQQISNENEELKRRLESTEIRLRSVTSLEEKVAQYSQQNQGLREELTKAKRGYQQVLAATGDTKTEIERLKHQNAGLSGELRRSRERVAALESAKRELEEQIQNLQQDLNDSFSF